MYWAHMDGVQIASDSQKLLVNLTKPNLNENRIALALCPNLPSYFRLQSPWDGLESAPVGHSLYRSEDGISSRRWWVVEQDEQATLEKAGDNLRGLLESSISRCVEKDGMVSTDLSGGMDSTALAFLVKNQKIKSTLYHATTNDPDNQDTIWARRAARELSNELVELESFTNTTSAFSRSIAGTDEPLFDGPPHWTTNSLYLRQVFGDAHSRGIRAHITGIGGDEVFSALPAVLLNLLKGSYRHIGRRSLKRLRQMQRWSWVEVMQAISSRRTLADELLKRSREETRYAIDSPHEAFSWAPGFGPSRFATLKANEMMRTAVEEAVAEGIQPHFPDIARHQSLEAVIFQGEVLRQVNSAYSSWGVKWVAPFLDDAVLALTMSLPAYLTAGSTVGKPLLAEACTGIAPAWVFTRQDKGEYSSDLFVEFYRQRGHLPKIFDDGYLVGHGLIDPKAVTDALTAPMVGTDALFALEHLVAIERWARDAV